MKRPILLLLIFCALASCKRFPELDARLTPDVLAQDYEPLVPLDQVALPPEVDAQATEATAAELDARGAALRERQAALSQETSEDEDP